MLFIAATLKGQLSFQQSPAQKESYSKKKGIKDKSECFLSVYFPLGKGDYIRLDFPVGCYLNM